MWWFFVREFYQTDKPAEHEQPAAEPVPAAKINARIEAKLQKLEAALAVSERGHSAFLSAMSHELRTPLNAILGFSEMMKSGVFGPLNHKIYQNYCEHIHESGLLLLNKINDLLEIASMDAGEQELAEQMCDVTTLLTEAVEIHSHAAFERDQVLTIDCTEDFVVEGDRAKLLCVLSHFVSNALRHSKDGGTIALSVRTVPYEGMIVSVRDDGEGIAAEQLATIRDALQKDAADFAIEPGGMGIGLALARELAAAHSGKVMIDSIRHRGTVVSLVLPPKRVRAGLPRQRRQRS